MNTLEIEKRIARGGYRCHSVGNNIFEVIGGSGKPLMRIEVLDGGAMDAGDPFEGFGECEDCEDKEKEIQALQDTMEEIERLAARHT